MTLIIYALLLALNLITSPAEFDQLPIEEQQEMMIVIEDLDF